MATKRIVWAVLVIALFALFGHLKYQQGYLQGRIERSRLVTACPATVTQCSATSEEAYEMSMQCNQWPATK